MRPSSVPRSVELRLACYPALLIDGAAVPVKLKRGLALLAYLAECGRQRCRNELAALLWPDADAGLGRARLRRIAHRINVLAGIELLRGDTHTLTLAAGDAQRAISDVEATRRAARELLAAQPAHPPPAQVAALLDPAAHRLLDGFRLDGGDAFDDWLALRRAELERLVARALRRLAQRLTLLGQGSLAAAAAERLIAVDPLAEAGYAALLGARSREGDRAAVEAAYFRCAEMLRSEFGARPSARFEAAYASACATAPAPAGVAAFATACAAASASGCAEAGRSVEAAVAPAAAPLPRIDFAPSRDGAVAYAVTGRGPQTLIVLPGLVSHIEIAFEEPRIRRAMQRLGEHCRVVLFDRRGTGLSERIGVQPTAQAAVDDIVAVLERLGVERTWLLGSAACGAVAIDAAATHPRRVEGLLLVGANARGAWAPDYPWALKPDAMDKWLAILQAGWGGPVSLRAFAPSAAGDPALQVWWARLLRHATSPNGIATLVRAFHAVDARHHLPTLRVPALVLHREGDAVVRAGAGRYLASMIPGATLVMLPGDDHFWWHGDADAVLDAIERFMARHRTQPASRHCTGALATA